MLVAKGVLVDHVAEEPGCHERLAERNPVFSCVDQPKVEEERRQLGPNHARGVHCEQVSSVLDHPARLCCHSNEQRIVPSVLLHPRGRATMTTTTTTTKRSAASQPRLRNMELDGSVHCVHWDGLGWFGIIGWRSGGWMGWRVGVVDGW